MLALRTVPTGPVLEADLVPAQSASLLATRRCKLLLLLLQLCAVQFLDVVDSSIMNVALQPIRRDLGFSVQGLQWVLSGYLVTYRGVLLGGCASDLLGRRRLLAAGTALFAVCSLPVAWPWTRACWTGARLGQGAGAAMMSVGRAVDPDH